MKFVIQRVTRAGVSVNGRVIGQIGIGILVLIGIGKGDTEADADRLVDKMLRLRIFEDAAGKTNQALADVGGGVLLVSQFTLYANCSKGNRPSFGDAETPERAQALYDYITARCRERVPKTEAGCFGADMEVELVNDGPFTILLE